MSHEILQRIFDKIDFVQGAGGCWLWRGAKIGKGRKHEYGVINLAGKVTVVNRLIYQYEHGAIGEDMFACHTCDTPSCVNPAHIFAGSQRENIHDAIKKGRLKNPPHHLGEESSNVKLTASDVVNIRNVYSAGGISQAKIAKQYSVYESLISLIIRRRLWKHIA